MSRRTAVSLIGTFAGIVAVFGCTRDQQRSTSIPESASLKTPLSAEAGAAELFASKDNVYQVPLHVSQHAAVLDFGLKQVLEFAYKERASGQWTYAFTSAIPRDSDTGKFSPGAQGSDRFIRFFGDEQAEIIIEWTQERGATPLAERFQVLAESLARQYREADASLQVEMQGAVEHATVGGLPAIGARYAIARRAGVTLWVVADNDAGRLFFIRFFYAGGFTDPAGDFAKVREGIIFSGR